MQVIPVIFLVYLFCKQIQALQCITSVNFGKETGNELLFDCEKDEVCNVLSVSFSVKGLKDNFILRHCLRIDRCLQWLLVNHTIIDIVKSRYGLRDQVEKIISKESNCCFASNGCNKNVTGASPVDIKKRIQKMLITKDLTTEENPFTITGKQIPRRRNSRGGAGRRARGRIFNVLFIVYDLLI